MLPDFYQRYVNNFDGLTVAGGMLHEKDLAIGFYKSIDPAIYEHRYATNKWSIKEILGHVIDGERIFGYRALRFARNDGTELPGFDENGFVPEMNTENRTFETLISEFANIRTCSIDLWSGFTNEMLLRRGMASGTEFTVEEIGKILVGHEIHHRKIIRERYLKE